MAQFDFPGWKPMIKLNAKLVHNRRPWPGHMIPTILDMSDIIRSLERNPEQIAAIRAFLESRDKLEGSLW